MCSCDIILSRVRNDNLSLSIFVQSRNYLIYQVYMKCTEDKFTNLFENKLKRATLKEQN